MALFDNNPISALTNPVTSGIGSLFEGMTPFGSTIPSGILTEDQEAKLRNQALVQGLLGTAATYLATPKNLNAGSPLPYIGKAVLGGMGASQDVIDRAIRARLLAGKDDNIRTYEKDRQKITEQYNPMTKKWEVLGTSALDAPQQQKEEKPLDIERLISIRDRLKLENPNNPNIAIYEDLIQNARKGREGVNINLGSPVAGVNEKGEPVFFQPSKTGGAPSIIPGIKPPEATANKLTEGERTAGFLSERLNNSLNQLKTVTGEKPSAASPNIKAEAVKFFTRSDYLKNLTNPEARQQVEAAQYDILDSALTLGTGAAYTREQLESYRQSYFPQLGDKPKTVADKAKRLEGLLDAAYKKAGRAAPKEAQPQPSMTMPAQQGWSIKKKSGG